MNSHPLLSHPHRSITMPPFHNAVLNYVHAVLRALYHSRLLTLQGFPNSLIKSSFCSLSSFLVEYLVFFNFPIQDMFADSTGADRHAVFEWAAPQSQCSIVCSSPSLPVASGLLQFLLLHFLSSIFYSSIFYSSVSARLQYFSVSRGSVHSSSSCLQSIHCLSLWHAPDPQQLACHSTVANCRVAECSSRKKSG